MSHIDEIRTEFDNLIKATVLGLQRPEYRSDYHLREFKKPEHVGVSAMEGGQAELKIDFRSVEDTSLPPKVTAAIAEMLDQICDIDPKRISQHGSGPDMDYGMAFYTGTLKALVPDTAETVEKLKEAQAYIETGGLGKMLVMKELRKTMAATMEKHAHDHPHLPVDDKELAEILSELGKNGLDHGRSR